MPQKLTLGMALDAQLTSGVTADEDSILSGDSKFVFVVGDMVIRDIYFGPLFARILNAEPVIVDVTNCPNNDKIAIGWQYNHETGEFYQDMSDIVVKTDNAPTYKMSKK